MPSPAGAEAVSATDGDTGRLGDEGSKRGYFEGWYFKQTFSDGRVIALIPGVSLGSSPHAFIQINDSVLGSCYIRFSLDTLSIDRNALNIRIAGNLFSLQGLELDLESPRGVYQGRVGFSEVSMLPPTLLRPGIMGPFSYIPGMECYHGLVSMDHRLHGGIRITLPGQTAESTMLSAEGGRGYIEKDFGSSFPHAWIWMQANHFSDSGASIMLSYAHIPLGSRGFPGQLGFFRHPEFAPRGTVFGTYSRRKIRSTRISGEGRRIDCRIADKERGGNFRLAVQGITDGGRELIAPARGNMERRIKETVSGTIRLTLYSGTELLWEAESNGAGMEIQGPVERLLKLD
ncbi:hypothetical protein L21SP2_2934 [Salinispira pacifica]|uniref:Tocopherol cyclase n=1 Tax=Salinispira pacifica TaxID=1307761 RepID=V5WKV8_9SPIO|nr:hypothetical protein L21SP2_2934 [Salinispira pacifica]